QEYRYCELSLLDGHPESAGVQLPANGSRWHFKRRLSGFRQLRAHLFDKLERCSRQPREQRGCGLVQEFPDTGAVPAAVSLRDFQFPAPDTTVHNATLRVVPQTKLQAAHY